jgi:MobA/MobL family
MAIYSCNLKSIGRTTHVPGTAGAHIRYISREDARPVIIAEHMPIDPVQARTWMDGRERAMRKNARVIDKIRLALPRELSKDQRAELVRAFMNDLTGRRVPWFAAIHQSGGDAHNPHAHIAVHDRDIDHGKRVLRLSDNARDRIKAGLPGPKAVDWIRVRWEAVCNRVLAKAGFDVRIDHRTLSAQGLDRKPTIHEGPRAQHIHEHVKRPESRKRINGCGRVIDYPFIDEGRTRREFNAHIIDLNLARDAGSDNAVTRVWAQFEKEQMIVDARLEKRLVSDQRQRTTALRRASQTYLHHIRDLRIERDQKLHAAIQKVRKQFAPRRETMRNEQHAERRKLKDRQSRLHIRIFTMLDLTGMTRRRQEAVRKELSALHKADRKELSVQYRDTRNFAESAVKNRYAGKIENQQGRRLSHMARLEEQHRQVEIIADRERQQRELEREQIREITERKIQTWKKTPSGQEKMQADPTFMKALQKAAKQEDDRGKNMDDGKDRER